MIKVESASKVLLTQKPKGDLLRSAWTCGGAKISLAAPSLKDLRRRVNVGVHSHMLMRIAGSSMHEVAAPHLCSAYLHLEETEARGMAGPPLAKSRARAVHANSSHCQIAASGVVPGACKPILKPIMLPFAAT